MATGNDCYTALETMNNNIKKKVKSFENINSIEKDNKYLLRKKMFLLNGLPHSFPVQDCITQVKAMGDRQQEYNNCRAHLKQQAQARCEQRTSEAASKAATHQKMLEELKKYETDPHSNVNENLTKLDEDISVNRAKIEELSTKLVNITKKMQDESFDGVKSLFTLLSDIEKEQSALFDILEQDVHE